MVKFFVLLTHMAITYFLSFFFFLSPFPQTRTSSSSFLWVTGRDEIGAQTAGLAVARAPQWPVQQWRPRTRTLALAAVAPARALAYGQGRAEARPREEQCLSILASPDLPPSRLAGPHPPMDLHPTGLHRARPHPSLLSSLLRVTLLPRIADRRRPREHALGPRP